MKRDYLIIGAGLAGSLLTWTLKARGCSTFLVSDPATASASRAAAGLINPVTGQRLVLQANIDALLASAYSLYRDIEKRFDITILHRRDMLRLFRNDRERSAWEKRKTEADYRPFIDERLCSERGSDGFIQRHTGHLDTNLLLDTLHRYFREQAVMIEAKVDYRDIERGTQGVRWQDIEASRIIFCEGWRGRENPWFAHLPFQPAKGEILTMQGPAPERIVNRGKWLLPVGDNSFKLGATYNREQLDDCVTERAEEELLAALPLLVTDCEGMKVTGHVAGVRPGTVDKHPFIGLHHEQPDIAIFNGFGSKGSLLIPWHAERFAAHLLEQEALPAEADIGRYHG